MRGFLADRRYAWREFSAPNDRNGMGGVLGIDPGSGSVEPAPLQHHAYHLQQHHMQQQVQQQVQQQQQRVIVITPRLSLPINTAAASAVAASAAAAAGNAGASRGGRAAASASGIRVGGAYVPGTGVTRAGFAGTTPGAPPAREIRSAVDDGVAAMRKADVVAAAAAEPTAEAEEVAAVENLAA